MKKLLKYPIKPRRIRKVYGKRRGGVWRDCRELEKYPFLGARLVNRDEWYYNKAV